MLTPKQSGEPREQSNPLSTDSQLSPKEMRQLAYDVNNANIPALNNARSAVALYGNLEDYKRLNVSISYTVDSGLPQIEFFDATSFNALPIPIIPYYHEGGGSEGVWIIPGKAGVYAILITQETNGTYELLPIYTSNSDGLKAGDLQKLQNEHDAKRYIKQLLQEQPPLNLPSNSAQELASNLTQAVSSNLVGKNIASHKAFTYCRTLLDKLNHVEQKQIVGVYGFTSIITIILHSVQRPKFDNKLQDLATNIGFESIDDMLNGFGQLFLEIKKLEKDIPNGFITGNVLAHANGQPLLTSSAQIQLLSGFDIPQTSLDAINSRVSTMSKGLIPSLDLGSNVIRALINVVTLDIPWVTAFNPKANKDDLFYIDSKTKKTLEFMQQTSRVPYYEDGEGQWVSLPLQHGASMYIFLPATDTTVTGTPSQPKTITEGVMKLCPDDRQNTPVQITLPKIDITTTNDFTELLSSHQLGRMLEGILGSFDKLEQQSRIVVAESGVKASSATYASMRGGDKIYDFKTFFANRPFQFWIVHDEKPLFAGSFLGENQ